MKKGFTLAEVLITLGIIGIVAAITIPTLISKYYEHQTVTRIKETYSILAQVFKYAEDEYDPPANWGFINAHYNEDNAINVANKIKPYLKIALDCGTYDSQGRCFTNKNFKLLNGNMYRNPSTDRSFYKVVLMNGTAVLWGVNYVDATKYLIDFIVDVNSYSSPNTLGIDIFSFGYDVEKNGLYLFENEAHCIETGGTGCAYHIVTYGNMDYLKKHRKK